MHSPSSSPPLTPLQDMGNQLYVTYAEHSGVHGQHSAASRGAKFTETHNGMVALPFDCCALSLQQWQNPVCVRGDGTIFELTRIIPYLKEYGTNPATGAPLAVKDLVRLNFHKNEEGKWHDPVSFKLFNEHTHIVAIEPSGNVFTYETVQQLNVKARHLRDLVDDTPFTKAHIITLQDPHSLGGGGAQRTLANMHHVKEKHVVPPPAAAKSAAEELNVGATGGAASLVAKLRDQRVARETAASAEYDPSASTKAASSSTTKPSVASAAARKDPYHSASTSSGSMAASFTSSGITPQTRSEREVLNEEEFMFEQIAAHEGMGARKGKGKGSGSKAYVRITTNFGALNFELHCDKAPKTCYNWLTLAKRGYYNDTTFHRLIPNFMVQGGDPTGTGRGGESIWKAGFRDELDAPGALRHTERGTLSMANRGPGTNGSQFFITFREKIPSLDTKHTVFGRLVDDDAGEDGKGGTLSRIEQVPTEKGTDRPLRTVRILDVMCLEDDPFDTYKANLERHLNRDNPEEVARRDEKRKRREEDRTTWLGTKLAAKGEQAAAEAASDEAAMGLMGSASGVGKYLATAAASTTKRKAPEAPVPEVGKKKKSGGGFGDFSGW